jgi:hypothetical protein
MPKQYALAAAKRYGKKLYIKSYNNMIRIHAQNAKKLAAWSDDDHHTGSMLVLLTMLYS